MIRLFLDLIIILLLLVVPFVGFKKGLILSCVGLFSALFCVVLAVKITPLFADFVETRTNIPQFISNILADANNKILNLGENSKLFSVLSNVLGLQTKQFTLNNLLVGVFCFVFIYVFAKICICVVIKMLSKVVSRLPIIGRLNNILGLVFGVTKAMVMVFAMCAIVMTLSKIPEIDSFVLGQIEHSALYSVFSESSASVVNVFLNMVKN